MAHRRIQPTGSTPVWCQGRGCKSPAAPAAVMLTTPQKPLIERLGRAGENEAKPEDLPAGN
ncbi:hypothetical protein KVMX100_60390 [Klebsiella variicola]|nr:hypothetical protein KVMX100_60390 [Klebsiella variicola]